MTVFHFFNCAILTFGPHAVYYSATPLSEYDTLGTSVKAAVVYLGTALVKLVCRDGLEIGVDLVGGYYDAGDNMSSDLQHTLDAIRWQPTTS
ncbi:uncharacterized protein [Pyrus communis]|uniref:uncharacterized protein isoform X1 n=1 Tax=Pyrus communis TaxID=23211 RepID=UPI0035BFA16C